MRPEPNRRLDRFRYSNDFFPATPSGSNEGAFTFRFKGAFLTIISSGVDRVFGWEHVSISGPDRTPNWEEMQAVKELFWSDEETVLQFHPRKTDYVNINPNVLHLWRKVGVDHELPPKVCV